jgi:hypothetical protein
MQWSSSLTGSQILGVMSDEGRGLFRGCYWGEETHHAVFDIDQGSKYHNAQELTKLASKLAAVGLDLVPYQSSDGGGWHLYLFFDDWAPSKEVEKTLKAYLKAESYEIKSGTLEIFPSGNALRLPLQKGFGWLAPDGQLIRRREELREDEALASFRTDLENNACNWDEAKERIESQLSTARASAGESAQEHREAISVDGMGDLFRRGIDWEKYQAGREYWLYGLTGPNQRHYALHCIGHYLWFGDSSQGLRAIPGLRNAEARAELIRSWFGQKHNGQSKAFNSGRLREVEGDIERACQWTCQGVHVEEYEPYPLTDRLLKRLAWLYQKTGKVWTVDELSKANIDRSQDARQRIAVAVAQLEMEGQDLDQAKVARRAGACRKTVRKHSDLLDRWGGVYSGGAGGPVRVSSAGPHGSCPEEEEDFLSVLSVADSGDLDVSEDSCSEELVSEIVPLAGGRSALASDVALVELSEQIFIRRLTPYAETLRGDGEQLNGKIHLRLLPPSHPASLAMGSIAGALTCRLEPLGTCGINGILPSSAEPTPGPLHLILGDFCTALCARSYVALGTYGGKAIFSMGAWVANLTARVPECRQYLYGRLGEGRGTGSRAPPLEASATNFGAE